MSSLAKPAPKAVKERKRAAPSGAGTPTHLKKAKPAVKAAAPKDVSRSFILELGSAGIKPSRVKSESWPLHGYFDFQFNPKISDDYTTTVFQKKALETYKEKIGDIYENTNKILDEWKGVEMRIDPSLCTLDSYGYLKCYTTVVGADGDSVTEKKKEELNLCCRAFVMSLIETVFGCVWYHVMDNVVRQINLNPVNMKTVYFDVPTEFEEYKTQICEQWERKYWANPEEKEALRKLGPVGFVRQSVKAATPAAKAAAPAKAADKGPAAKTATAKSPTRLSLEQRAFLEQKSLVKAVVTPAAPAKAAAKFKKLVEGKEGECTACGDNEKIYFDDGTDKLCKQCTSDHQVEDEQKCPYEVFQCQAYCKNKFVILKNNTCPACHDKGPYWKEDWVNDGAGDWVPPKWDLDTPFEQYKAMGYKKGSCVCGWEGHRCELNSPLKCEGGICDYDYIRKNWDEPGKDWWKRPICEDCLNSCSRC